jgi:hypothetical protein
MWPGFWCRWELTVRADEVAEREVRLLAAVTDIAKLPMDTLTGDVLDALL